MRLPRVKGGLRMQIGGGINLLGNVVKIFNFRKFQSFMASFLGAFLVHLKPEARASLGLIYLNILEVWYMAML